MKKEWLLLVASVTASVALALFVIRFLAPGLLGIPIDLQVVRVSDEVAPFYESVFGGASAHSEASDPQEFLIRDPYVGVRARPLFPDRHRVGPNDVLGFRNRSVPNTADVITIGDSQTYGNDVRLEANWPSRLMQRLAHKDTVVYSMATGGWGAVQYLDMFDKALAFRPKLIIVAFYTGNDPRESFRLAYSIEKWAFLQPDPDLTLSDQPSLKWPPPPEEIWRVRLPSGQELAFTPRVRLASSEDHPTVDAAWKIMHEVARRIATSAQAAEVRVLFTVLPTKETVFAPRLRQHDVSLDPTYAELVRREQLRTEELAASLTALPGAEYADVIKPLQRAVLRGALSYPSSPDSHPTSVGHATIGEVLAGAAEPWLSARHP